MKILNTVLKQESDDVINQEQGDDKLQLIAGNKQNDNVSRLGQDGYKQLRPGGWLNVPTPFMRVA